jgi:hypothetical protein
MAVVGARHDCVGTAPAEHYGIVMQPALCQSNLVRLPAEVGAMASRENPEPYAALAGASRTPTAVPCGERKTTLVR